MAKKQTKAVEQPSREEEEQVSTEEEHEEVTSVAAAGKHDSDSDSVPVTETKPIASTSKAKKKKKRSKKKEAQSLSVVAVASPKTTEKKRPIGEGSVSDESDVKRHKTEEKRQPFERLWSEQDEIVLLKSVMEFGKDPNKDKIGFHETVKSLISVEVSNSQLLEKIRALRTKFYKKAKKGLSKIRKAHDRTCFEISERIWGVNGIAVKSGVKKEVENNEPVHGGQEWFEKSFLVGLLSATFPLGEEWVKKGWSLVSMERKSQMHEKLKILEKKAVAVGLEKKDLFNDAASAIAEYAS